MGYRRGLVSDFLSGSPGGTPVAGRLTILSSCPLPRWFFVGGIYSRRICIYWHRVDSYVNSQGILESPLVRTHLADLDPMPASWVVGRLLRHSLFRKTKL